MPAVSAPATVLVTGATGYVAAHVVQAFIAAGFTVIGTVRRASGGEYLQKRFPERFSFVVVEDIQTAGALDALTPQVDVIAHTASPVTQPPGDFDPQLLIGPALDGTRNVLASASIPGSKVQRIVITSSIACVYEPHDGPYVYTENDWNLDALKVVEELGNKAPSKRKYQASKVLAAREVIEFVAKNKPAFDVVDILPTYVYGPIISDIKSLDALPSSLEVLWHNLTRPDLRPVPEADAESFVDVRDVARMHVDAAIRPELSGARLIAAHAVPLTYQDFYDAYYSIPEHERPKIPVPLGRPGAGDVVRDTLPRFARDSQGKFGWELRGLVECIKDTLQSFVDKQIL